MFSTIDVSLVNINEEVRMRHCETLYDPMLWMVLISAGHVDLDRQRWTFQCLVFCVLQIIETSSWQRGCAAKKLSTICLYISCVRAVNAF